MVDWRRTEAGVTSLQTPPRRDPDVAECCGYGARPRSARFIPGGETGAANHVRHGYGGRHSRGRRQAMADGIGSSGLKRLPLGMHHGEALAASASSPESRATGSRRGRGAGTG